MKLDTKVFPDIDALSGGAFDQLFGIVQDSVAQRGRFAIALAGGHTPARLYSLWAHAEKEGKLTPWDRVHLFWGDERLVPQDDPLSNYRMASEKLIALVPIPRSNVHPVRTDLSSPEQAAEDYDAQLRKFFGAAAPAFDLQLLGLGVEGHTASLFPGSPALDETKRWAMAVEVAANPPRRLTLTPVVLNAAENTFFLVAGADKREILAALRSEPDSTPSKFPAGRIRPQGPVTWFLDALAAG
jgi:6-phosphogluconolactonase